MKKRLAVNKGFLLGAMLALLLVAACIPCGSAYAQAAVGANEDPFNPDTMTLTIRGEQTGESINGLVQTYSQKIEHIVFGNGTITDMRGTSLSKETAGLDNLTSVSCEPETSVSVSGELNLFLADLQSLTSVDLSGFVLENVSGMVDMLNGANLNYLNLPQSIGAATIANLGKSKDAANATWLNALAPETIVFHMEFSIAWFNLAQVFPDSSDPVGDKAFPAASYKYALDESGESSEKPYSEWQEGPITVQSFRPFVSVTEVIFTNKEKQQTVVTFDEQNPGSSQKVYDTLTLTLGKPYDALSDDYLPKASRYSFKGWFTAPKDGECLWDDNLQPTAKTWEISDPDIIVYAHWMKNPRPPTPPTPTPDPDNPKPEEEQGWNYNESGGWYYVFDNEGRTYSDGWHWIEDVKFGNHWYYFKDTGFIATNQWIFTDAWYYVNSSGAMNVGTWNWINNAWYGFNWNGTMCKDWTFDSNYHNWFYCDPTSGAMYTNCWSFINGAWYGFWANGEMCRGWVWDSSYNGWFYCSPSDDHMYTSGWYRIDGRAYYFNPSGLLV